MFLSAYHFDGEPIELIAAYDRLVASLPTSHIHVCIERDHGLSVYDTCPDEATFRRFSASAEFRRAVAASWLPSPRLEPLGTVHRALTPQQVA